MNCVICGIRRPRRHCPGVGGDICSICCGTEREVSVNCPLSCEYLREAHRHEKVPAVDPSTFPNGDIRVTEEFIQGNEMLVGFAGSAVYLGSLDQAGAIDLDVREALEAQVRNYRAKLGGSVCDVRPAGPVATAIAVGIQAHFDGLRNAEDSGRSVPDDSILRVVAFLQRLEIMNNNGRPKSKAFLDFLGRFAIAPPENSAEQTAPLVIL